MDTPAYDLIVFGATGFVGRLITGYLAEYGAERDELRWAVAGRSQTKLEALKASLGDVGKEVPVIVADASDESTLYKMCEQTRVIISTVGPYTLYGEPLVKACVTTGTDYCDLTGEIQWVHRMIARYESTAKETGARIVNCCGFDSIPSDMGVFFLQRNALERHGRFCSHIKMRIAKMKGSFSGGTIASLILGIKEAKADKAVRRVFTDPYSLCPPGTSSMPSQKSLMSARYDEEFASWSAPFVMAIVNEHVVQRSNAIADPAYSDPLFYGEGVLTGPERKGRRKARRMSLSGGLFLSALLIAPLRWMLERFFLPAPGKGPSPEAQAKGFFDMRFWGGGLDGKTLMVKVAGDRDPGYGSTSKMVSQAGICLAKDISKDAKKGGFWTPSTIFGGRLIMRLSAHAGMTFEVIE